jgi:Icc-related predicted phosphoesterase
VATAVRLAALGDLHCDGDSPDTHRLGRVLVDAAAHADVLLLAGDLTAGGTPRQTDLLARLLAPLPIPVVAVLGNHDRQGRVSILRRGLESAGVVLLDGEHHVVEVAGRRLGIAGATGSWGGFAEAPATVAAPARERMQARASEQAAALGLALEQIADADVRVVLLHYAPTTSTLEGERPEIWPWLGSEQLAVPIRAQAPNLVFHAHAHTGTFAGSVGTVPVYNVSSNVLRHGYQVFHVH